MKRQEQFIQTNTTPTPIGLLGERSSSTIRKLTEKKGTDIFDLGHVHYESSAEEIVKKDPPQSESNIPDVNVQFKESVRREESKTNKMQSSQHELSASSSDDDLNEVEQIITATAFGPLEDNMCPGEELEQLKKAMAKGLDDEGAMPITKTTAQDMMADIELGIKLGIRPKNVYSGAPIPLFYNFESFKVQLDGSSIRANTPIYYGPRVDNSIKVHRLYSRKMHEIDSEQYQFKFPPRPCAQGQRKRVEEPRAFTGMNPRLQEILGNNYDPTKILTFDSIFESGNLDMVYQRKDNEYNLYMRVDANTKGHHQWFYFSTEYMENFAGKTVTFNIMNFTKNESLYGSGMRVAISKKSEDYKWHRGGSNFSYQQSRHIRRKSSDPSKIRYFYQLSFTYKFTEERDKVYFAYCFPYSYSNLQNFLKSLKQTNSLRKGPAYDFYQESVLCKSLSGADLPLLTITSRLCRDPNEYNLVKMEEFEDHDSKVSMPMYKKKKYVIITGRVHPGESNSSWMMQGFIKCLMGNSLQAKQLRKRIIFKIVPMLNVDGVIIGNYRTSMTGNDLNRRYIQPDPRLHPEVCGVKNLIQELTYGKSQCQGPEIRDEEIMAFVDMHGHSRKKNVFIYGPQYSLSSDKYYRCRLLPKLMSEETSKFRYHSCQFKYEHSKRKTARIVLSREYNIMNCYTLEASFHGHFDSQRNNFEFSQEQYEEMGEVFVNSLYEYVLIMEEEQRLKQLKEIEKKKRKKNIMNSKKTNMEGQQSFKSNVGGSNIKKGRRILKVNDSGLNVLSAADAVESASDSPMKPSEANTVEGNKKETGAIRSLNYLFGQLQKDESIRKKMEKVEEEELGFAADREEPKVDFEPDFDNSESGEDTDASDGELGGKEKEDLFSDIFTAIKQFSDQYDGQTSYNEPVPRNFQKKKQKKKKPQKLTHQMIDSANVASKFLEPLKQKANTTDKKGKKAPPTVPHTKLDRFPRARPSGSNGPKSRDEEAYQVIQSPKVQIRVTEPSSLKTNQTAANSHLLVQDVAEEREARRATRQRMAQQGIINRMGMKVQANQIVSPQSFPVMKYSSVLPMAPQAVERNGALSPLVVNKIYTNENNKDYQPNKIMKQNPHERRAGATRNQFYNQQKTRAMMNVREAIPTIFDQDNFVRHGGPDPLADFVEPQNIESYLWQKYGFPLADIPKSENFQSHVGLKDSMSLANVGRNHSLNTSLQGNLASESNYNLQQTHGSPWKNQKILSAQQAQQAQNGFHQSKAATVFPSGKKGSALVENSNFTSPNKAHRKNLQISGQDMVVMSSMGHSPCGSSVNLTVQSKQNLLLEGPRKNAPNTQKVSIQIKAISEGPDTSQQLPSSQEINKQFQIQATVLSNMNAQLRQRGPQNQNDPRQEPFLYTQNSANLGPQALLQNPERTTTKQLDFNFQKSTVALKNRAQVNQKPGIDSYASPGRVDTSQDFSNKTSQRCGGLGNRKNVQKSQHNHQQSNQQPALQMRDMLKTLHQNQKSNSNLQQKQQAPPCMFKTLYEPKVQNGKTIKMKNQPSRNEGIQYTTSMKLRQNVQERKHIAAQNSKAKDFEEEVQQHKKYLTATQIHRNAEDEKKAKKQAMVGPQSFAHTFHQKNTKYPASPNSNFSNIHTSQQKLILATSQSRNKEELELNPSKDSPFKNDHQRTRSNLFPELGQNSGNQIISSGEKQVLRQSYQQKGVTQIVQGPFQKPRGSRKVSSSLLESPKNAYR